jgi:astacin
MHAAGFYHEQCRTDRDDYVVVNWDNIQEGFKLNFNKLGPDMIQYLGAPYDIGLLFHNI